MKYKEFKKAVENWGRIYGYNSVVEGVFSNKYIAIKDEYDVQTICEIPNTQRFVIDLNWYSYKILSENAKGHLFEIVTEFAKTKPEDRECEDREDNATLDSIVRRLKIIQHNAEDVMNWTLQEIQERNCDLRDTLEDMIIDLEEYENSLNKRPTICAEEIKNG